MVQQVVIADVDDAGLDGAADYREPDEGCEDLGKERDNVDREHERRVFRDREEFACALEALDRRDFVAAEAQLGSLLEREPRAGLERAFLLNKRGVARIGLERLELAEADFRSALEARARYAPALTNLGNLLLESDRLGEAILHYERAIASDSEYAIAYLNLSVAYKRAGRIAEGVRALRQAERLEQRSRVSVLRSFRPFRRR